MVAISLIAPEKLLRALLLLVLYGTRSERLLMEQLDYNPLVRWFIGLNDVPGQEPLTILREHRRIPDGVIAQAFFAPAG